MRFLSFADRLMKSRSPDFTIGPKEAPYLKRWWVIPRNRFFNIYVHLFLQSDTDEALHDHMYLNCSVILRGGYLEHFEGGLCRILVAGDVVFRRAKTPHRVELPYGVPVTTIFITGPRIREWGFHCPKGWVHWEKFVEASKDGNKRGKGCA